MRIGLLGAGAMGAMHAEAWTRVSGVRLAGVVGRTPGRAGALASRHGVPVFTDARSLLEDASVDAIDVTVPTALHRETVEAALACGKHVFCETPLVSTVADADALLVAAERSGRILQTALLSRVAEPGALVRTWLRDGSLGRPLVASFERLWPGLDQLFDPADHHGDALEEIALFDVDWALWCFGMPARVAARARGAGRHEVAHVVVALGFADVEVVVEASEALPASFPFRIGARIVCEEATVEWTLRFAGDGPPRLQAIRHPRHGPAEPVPVSPVNPYDVECARFAAVVRGEADPALLGAAAARDGLRVVEAARESCRTGRSVPVG